MLHSAANLNHPGSLEALAGQRFRFVFPIVKAGSVAGLLAGLRWRSFGRLTTTAVTAYFVAALGFHVRANDPPRKYFPALGMLVWSYGALRALRSSPT